MLRPHIRLRTLNLELLDGRFYFQRMKQVSILFMALSLCAGPVLYGQDAAVEERLNKLNGHVEDLLAAQAEQQKRLAAQAKEIESLRAQQSQPNASYASQEDLRKVAEKFQAIAQEIDQKRQADKELILKEIEKLGKTVSMPPAGKKSAPKAAPAPVADPTPAAATPEKGYGFYTIKPNDTLSGIVKLYKDQTPPIKVTVDQILKANPGLEATKLKEGQKIWIPGPAQ
jgi:nucleoid-associated protein YgaU